VSCGGIDGGHNSQATVIIAGLKTKPKLNGVRGLVVAEQDERWGVQLPSKKTVYLKPKVLTVVSASDDE
jgi:hypothetical protein